MTKHYYFKYLTTVHLTTRDLSLHHLSLIDYPDEGNKHDIFNRKKAIWNAASRPAMINYKMRHHTLLQGTIERFYSCFLQAGHQVSFLH